MADTKQRVETILGRMREAGFKLTPQRLAIVDVLAESAGHPSVEQIHGRLKKRFPTMSLATVYRNVMMIKSLGEVLELGFADGSNRYDGNKPYPHPHVVCTRCKAILDPDLESLGDMTAEVTRETGYAIHHHRLDFFGICPHCRREKGSG